jgi:RNA polymerase sigma factor (sigma-70 family)
MVSIPAAGVTDSNEALVRLAARGNEGAFATIVERHHADMVRVCYVVCGDRELAEDAVAVAWPLAWRRLGTLRDPDRLRPWLCTVAANEARRLSQQRRRVALVEVSMDAASSAYSSTSDPGGRITDLDLIRALDGLDPRDRTLLALRYVAGLNATELARAIGLSAPGTRARLARLLDRLRKELGDA